MKKLLAVVLIAILLSALALPVLAAEDGPVLGTVPKTNIPIVIDGIRDEVYNHGLIVPVNLCLDSEAHIEAGAGGGTAYLLWDDENLYVFFEINVHSIYRPEHWDILTRIQYWELDSAEVGIDFSNEGFEMAKFEACALSNEFAGVNAAEFGVDYTSRRNDSFMYLEVATNILSDTRWNAEFKIKMSNFESQRIAPAGFFTEGSAIGINLMITDAHHTSELEIFTDTEEFVRLSWDGFLQTNYYPTEVRIFDKDSYPQIFLGPLTAATTLSTAVDTPADTGDAEGGGDTGTGGGRTNHQHGDASMLVFVIPGMMAAAAVIFKKARK
jgi:hypothetical protein